MAELTSSPCRLIGKSLTNTTNTAILTAKNYTHLISVHIANITSSDATADVSVFSDNDNAAYYILKGHTVPANGAIEHNLRAFALNADDEVRVKAGTSNALDVILSIVEIPGRSG